MPRRGELFEILDKKIVGITVFFQLFQCFGEYFLRDIFFPLDPRGKLLGRAAGLFEEFLKRGNVGRSSAEELKHDAFLFLLGHGITSSRREYQEKEYQILR